MQQAPVKTSGLSIDWFPQKLDASVTAETAALRTIDGAPICGTLYSKGRPRTVVCLMHPREFFGFHYMVPNLVNAGVAVWTQGARSIGNDSRLEHERALLDVAAGMEFLRSREFQSTVLLGNSGGAGLYSLYLQQAVLPPERRIAATPAGKKVELADAEMPCADGVIFLAPHPGQGRLLVGCIDPSVADESDPLSVIPDLDPFNPQNGYHQEAERCHYDAAFISRYRAAQYLRVRKLDQFARDLAGRRLEARKRVREGLASQQDRVAAAHTPIMTIWRTDADLRCLDGRLDPSDRARGSIWGNDMYTSNYGAVGFARICTPDSWLSSWSATSSNAGLAVTAPSISVPTLLIEYTGDQTTFPSDALALYALLGMTDKQHIRVRGDHHGRPLAPEEEPGRDIAGRHICAWLDRHNFI